VWAQRTTTHSPLPSSMCSTSKLVSTLKMAGTLERSLLTYKKVKSNEARLELAQKILDAIICFFDKVSLQGQQRDELTIRMDTVFCALEADHTDARDDDVGQLEVLDHAQSGLNALFARLGRRKASVLQLQLLYGHKVISSDKEQRRAVKLASILAEVGKHICCEEEFDELYQFITRQLLDDYLEEEEEEEEEEPKQQQQQQQQQPKRIKRKAMLCFTTPPSGPSQTLPDLEDEAV
jgi:hypothetical protein